MTNMELAKTAASLCFSQYTGLNVHHYSTESMLKAQQS